MARQKGSAGRQECMGFRDRGSSGGYQSEKLDESSARNCAENDSWANEAAVDAQRKSQPNHVGGSRAST